MSSVVYIKSFNTLLSQFLSEMIAKYPTEKDIVVYEAKINLLAQSNPRMLVEEFMKNILPHKQQILNCDESYFLNLDNLNLSKEEHEKGLTFKDMYKNSDQRTKATIIAYFQKLLKFGEMALS